MLEKEVGLLCDSLATQLGWDVERYEQTRASRICEGLPDRRYVCRRSGARLWVELKKPAGKMTSAQHRWLVSELQAGGLAVVIDDVQALAAILPLAKGNSIARSVAREKCESIVALTASRGYR